MGAPPARSLEYDYLLFVESNIKRKSKYYSTILIMKNI